MPIEMSAEDRAQAVQSIRRYFREELDLDIGDLKAGALLEYFLRELGPSIHNRAVEHAQVFLRDRLADLDALAIEPPFGYWPKATVRGRGR